MHVSVRLCRFFCLLAIIYIAIQTSSLAAYAQITSVTNATATPMPGGHDYIQTLNETVNPANGSVSLRINIPTSKGRGLNIPLSWNYDSAGALNLNVDAAIGALQVSSNPLMGGWSLAVPSLNVTWSSFTDGEQPIPGVCTWESSFIFIDFQGQRHSLPLLHIETVPTGVNQFACSNAGVQGFESDAGSDGEYQAALTTFGGQATVSVADRDGTIYQFLYGGQVSFTGTLGVPLISITDRNGNVVTPGFMDPQGQYHMQDTLGRNVYAVSGYRSNGPNATTNPGPTTSISVSGVSDPYVATWSGQSTNFSLAYTPSTPTEEGCPTSIQVLGGNQSVSSLLLPDGQRYQFTYDPVYGLLSKVIYPGGGYVRYDWENNPQSDDALLQYPDPFVTQPSNPTGQPLALSTCYGKYDWPAIQHRYVSYDGVNVALQQDFAYTTTFGTSGITNGQDNAPGWTAKTTKVVSKDLVRGTTTTKAYTYAASPPEPVALVGGYNSSDHISGPIAVETQVIDSDQSGVIQTVNQSWFDSRRKQSESVIRGGMVDETDYDYAATLVFSPGAAGSGPTAVFIPNHTAIYDFGAGGHGPLLRRTETQYATFGLNPLFPVGSSLLDRPSQITNYDANGNVASTSVFCYDQTGVSGVPGVIGFDNGDFGTNFNIRGNVTQQLNGLQAPNSTTPVISPTNCGQGGSASAVSSIFTHDQTGQVTSATDPCGNATCPDMSGGSHTITYSYTDSYSSGIPSGNTNAYLTQITYPAANGISQTERYSYRFADGQLSSSTDPDNQTTQYQYNDSFNRLTAINYPDQGVTSYAYQDAAPSPSVTTSQLLSATEGSKISVSVMDGMGHVRQAQLNSDPGGADYVDTTWDGLGRQYMVSNPHRSSSSPTDGVSTYIYDGIGRLTLITQPDSFTQKWSYSGNVATFTDEANHSWKQTSDALGRLTNVVEPTGASTSYSYDALSNLLRVNQQGLSGETPHIRSFVYDSLSRLTSSTNPETGTIGYTYDPNGNLQTKTDARGITVSYSYDALNRLTRKSYSDGTTPTAFYVYDTNAILFGTSQRFTTSNVIGRLSIICMSVPGGCQSMTAYSYDSMGRTIQTLSNTPSFPTTGTVYTVSATYDLAGNVTSLTYPDGRLVANTWNSAGQQQTTTFAGWDGQNVGYPYLTAATYWPSGGLQGFIYGNGLGVGYHMNNRLQVDQSSTGPLTGQALYNRVYCYGPATAPLSSSLPGCDALASANNGNVWEIKDGLNGGNTQTFSYDSLNRISGASVGGVVQQYGIDSFGNMSMMAGGTAITSFDAATNRMSNLPCAAAFSPYDSAGNQLCDSDPNGAFRWYQYDGESRISQIAMTGSSTPFETYNYDINGDRIRKSNVNGSFTEYVRFGGQNIAERNSDGSWSNYIFANGKIIARSDTSVNPLNGPASTTYYYSGLLGSTDALTDGNGGLITSSQFLPFGQEQSSGTSANHYKFTGKERDAETGGSVAGAGNDYFGARYYSSNVGRFMSPDWADKPEAVPYSSLDNPQSLNLYGYVGNNPLSMADADGHCCQWFSNFGTGLANSTYRPLVQMASHPGTTLQGIGTALSHPIATAEAMGSGIKSTSVSVMQGDGTAIGTAVGSAAMFFVPGGEEAEAAGGLSNLNLLGEAGEAASGAGISMSEAVAQGAAHVDGGVMETTGKGTNFQFRNTTTDANGNVTTKIGRFDVNPADPHVNANGPHLNMETQVNGKIQSNQHVPIDGSTVRPGDHP